MARRDHTYARRDSAVDQAVPDDLLVLDLRSGRYFSLGTVGAVVWELMDGSRTLGEIATEVCRRFDVDLERAEADVLEFARTLEECGLVTRTDPSC